MLTREQLSSLGDPTVELVREYEQALIDMLAETLAGIDPTNRVQVMAALGRVTLEAKRIERRYSKRIQDSAKRELDAAFYINAQSELNAF